MKDEEKLEIKLKDALTNIPSWEGSRQAMWNNIKENVLNKRRVRFVGIPKAAIAFVILLSIISTSIFSLKNGIFHIGRNVATIGQSEGTTSNENLKYKHSINKEIFANNPGMNLVKGPPSDYNIDFTSYIKDEVCQVGDSLTFDMSLVSNYDKLQIIDKEPKFVLKDEYNLENDGVVQEIPVPQLANKVITKETPIEISLKFKAPEKPGVYTLMCNLQTNSPFNIYIKGQFTINVLLPNEDVHIINSKEIDYQKSIINGYGIRIFNISSNEKETRLIFATDIIKNEFENYKFMLTTDDGRSINFKNMKIEESLPGQGKIKDNIIGSFYFDPLPKSENKIILHIINDKDIKIDGVTQKKGEVNIEIPIHEDNSIQKDSN